MSGEPPRQPKDMPVCSLTTDKVIFLFSISFLILWVVFCWIHFFLSLNNLSPNFIRLVDFLNPFNSRFILNKKIHREIRETPNYT